VLQIETILEFDPPHLIKKHEVQGEWKKTAICNVGDDIDQYYSWFLKKRFNLSLIKPMRGSHITIINDKLYDEQKYLQAKQIFNGKKIVFDYDPAEIRGGINPKGEGFWWLKVYNTDIEAIREFAGLNRKPFFNLHLTLGAVQQEWKKGIKNGPPPLEDIQIHQLHSEYIVRQMIKFGL